MEEPQNQLKKFMEDVQIPVDDIRIYLSLFLEHGFKITVGCHRKSVTENRNYKGRAHKSHTKIEKNPEVGAGTSKEVRHSQSDIVIRKEFEELQYPVLTDRVQLPSNMSLSTGAKDLLLRLLTIDPSRRLRSLYTLKTIAFFKNYDFEHVLTKKISPATLLRLCKSNKKIHSTSDIFADFDKQEDMAETKETTAIVTSSSTYIAEKLRLNVVTSV